MENPEFKSKRGIVGGVAIAAAIGLILIFPSPFGVIFGGVLLGAGVSTVQRWDTKGEFRFGSKIRALIGAIIASAVVVLAAAMTSITVAVIANVSAGVALAAISKAIKTADGEEVSWKDYWKFAVIGTLTCGIGALTGAVAHQDEEYTDVITVFLFLFFTALVNYEVKKIMGKRRGDEVEKGAHGGTIEAEVYARMESTKIIIHCDDGTVRTFGEEYEKTINLYYDSKEKHYSPADPSGKKLPTPTNPSSIYGNCFFESIGYHTGEDPVAIRKKVAKFEKEHPEELIRIPFDEYKKGGDLIGAGKGGVTLEKNEYQMALNAVSRCDVDKNVKRRLYESAVDGLRELWSISDRTLGLIKSQGKKIGRHNIHWLGEMDPELKDQLSIDVYDSNQPGRGPYRLIFKVGQGRQLKFKKFLDKHNHNALLRL